MELWITAKAFADKTPRTRNRYVDFLRAASICAVIVGHWMTPAPVVEDGALRFDHMLAFAPRTQFLTWLFQVMPVFFFVGGYSNAASWSSAQRDGLGTSLWLGKRLKRLLAPIVPLILFWSLAAFLTRRAEIDVGLASHASRLALIPVWFLAVYVMVTLAVPISYRTWRLNGMVSVWALVGSACLTDAIAVLFGLADIRWLNYGFIWMAIHQLGYAWREGDLERPSRAIGLALTGLFGLAFVILFLSYPVSMVTVPGAPMSNSRPPSIALLALGLVQVGLLLLAAKPARKWLERSNVWAGTIVLNRIIMTLFLWHVTVLILCVGVAWLLDGTGLRAAPGSEAWWWMRLPWLLVLILAVVPVLFVFARFEEAARDVKAGAVSTARIVIAAAVACAGLGFLARNGLVADTSVGVDVWPVVVTLAAVYFATRFPSPGTS
jgi:hypothetical protein